MKGLMRADNIHTACGGLPPSAQQWDGLPRDDNPPHTVHDPESFRAIRSPNNTTWLLLLFAASFDPVLAKRTQRRLYYSLLEL